MDAKDILDSVDKAKDKVDTMKEVIIKDELTSLIERYNEFKTLYVHRLLIIINIFVLLISKNPILWFAVMLGSTLIYVLPMISNYLEFKKDMRILDSVDITLMGRSLDNEEALSKRSAYTILQEYVTERFENDVLIFHNIKPGDVVNSTMEDTLLKDLVDSVISSMSPIVRDKFEMYFGPNIDKIIGRICFITVSIYAASSKKQILNTKPLNMN